MKEKGFLVHYYVWCYIEELFTILPLLSSYPIYGLHCYIIYGLAHHSSYVLLLGSAYFLVCVHYLFRLLLLLFVSYPETNMLHFCSFYGGRQSRPPPQLNVAALLRFFGKII